MWKPIPKFPNYSVSDSGEIKNNKTGRLLKIQKDGYGYSQISLYSAEHSKQPKTIKIHRAVLSAFCGESELQINHKNGIKSDNNLSNLEYCTAKENTIHAHKNGLATPARGTNHYAAKYTEEQIMLVKKLISEGHSIRDIISKTKVKKPTISAIKSNRTWKSI